MIPLGRIIRLQVQTSSLKVGSGANQRYDRSPVRSVPVLELDSGGVWGITEDNGRLADVHHRDHPASKLRDDINAISLLFTGHYTAMRERFGDHMVDGTASESILIERDALVRVDELAGGLFVETIDGGTACLEGIQVADPCAPFSRWVLRLPDKARPDRRVTEALQFLGSGMRGFYCRYSGRPVRIAVGGHVYLPL